MKKIFSLFITTLFCASLFAETWSVVGEPQSLFGGSKDWDQTNEATDMTQVGSSTAYSFEKVFEPALEEAIGTKFKIVKDHAWGTEYPSGNYEATIPVGTVLALFTFNTSNNGVDFFTSCTVAGPSVFFGTNWDATNTSNDMTYTDGVYKRVYSDVSLASGTLSFKVCQNHAWDHAWGGSGADDNYELSIEESGKYDIEITFNPYTYTVSATATLKEPEVVLSTVVLNGSWGANDEWEDLELTPDEGNLTASATKSFEAIALGTYEFGVKVDGNWTSNGSETTFSRSNYSVELTGYSGNMKLFVDVVEPLKFTWEYSSKTLTVTYPELPAQPVICGYATWNGNEYFSTVEFTPDGDNKSASYTRNLVAGTYKFRIVKNGTKISINGTNPDDKYRCVFHRDWNAAVIGGGTNDMIIRTDIPGSYTLKWTYENDSLTIIYPELPAIKYYVAHNFASEDVVATATEMTENAGVWSAETTISGTDAKRFKIYSVQGPYETWYGALNAENSLAATTAEPWELTNVNGGSDINITPNGGTGNYIFSFNPENKQLNVTFPSATTTAIDNVNGNDTPKKFVKDGVIYILRNGCVYDCNGRRAE